MNRGPVDKTFLVILLALVGTGFFIFMSASLGLLARNSEQFANVAFNQTLFGLIGGAIACFVFSRIDYRRFRPFAVYLFAASLILTFLVFIPGLGFSAGGATRWLDLGPFSLQPSEVLKFGFVLYFAAWLAQSKEKVREPLFGLVPLLVLLGIIGAALLAQPDTGTFGVIVAAGLAMFFVSGARIRDFLGIGALGIACVGVLAYMRPYVMDRILLFLDPSQDPLGLGYQIQQALIAIGSGEVSGRGFGQSIQKFNFLPEPIGDSIFAVAGEEFGFIGSVALIALFIAFAFRGLRIAARTPDRFGSLLATGIVTSIVVQSFANMGALLSILPLTGIPLVFVSHGGTALLISLAASGMVLNISRRKAS